jgi:hypothetical protein
MTLLIGISGCGSSSKQGSEDNMLNPYISQLDDLDTKGATGNLLSCMYSLKQMAFYPDDPEKFSTDLALRDALSEANKRALTHASGDLLKNLQSESGDWIEICSQLGEINWTKYEYMSIKSEALNVEINPGSSVWQRNLDMTGVGAWVERPKQDWQEDVGQQYLFVNKVNCLFYVFDENSKDRDLMQRAYQWLSQYSGIHIAGSNWILMDSSYGEKCTGPVTDTFGGYRVN